MGFKFIQEVKAAVRKFFSERRLLHQILKEALGLVWNMD